MGFFSEEVQKQLTKQCSNRCKNGGCLGKLGRCYRTCYCYGVSKAILCTRFVSHVKLNDITVITLHM